MALADLTAKQTELLESFDPALKRAGLAGILAGLIASANASESALADAAAASQLKIALVAGQNADDLEDIEDAATVVAIVAFTTATGAVAAKALLAPTTDYTVADGVITTVGDKSALTLLVIYRT